MNTEIIDATAILLAICLTLKKRQNAKLPLYICSKLSCMIWGLIGFGGLVSGWIQYREAVMRRAALEAIDPDTIVSTVNLLMRISLTLLFIGLICLIVSAIYFSISQRQKKIYNAA
jgi:hypothetical protein